MLKLVVVSLHNQRIIRISDQRMYVFVTAVQATAKATTHDLVSLTI
jgi:hypothetical protein